MRRPCPGGAFIALFAASMLPFAAAQEIQFNDSGLKPSLAQHVTAETETAIVRADQPDWIELHFRVDGGYHINAHDPHDDLLIPTTLRVTPATRLHLITAEYPAGTPLHLAIGAGETLNTYQGEFRVRIQIAAPRGNSTLPAVLHYQACDAASCFPPRDLPFQVELTAR